MASYVVLERRPVTGSRPETVFVRDDFSVLALIFPIVWLLWYRLWFAALMLLLVSGAIGIAGEYLAPGAATVLAGTAVSLFVALEGPAWRIAHYRRDGFVEAGTVVARDLDDAEIRWFSGHAAPEAANVPRPAPQPSAFGRTPRETDGDVLFGYAEEPAR